MKGTSKKQNFWLNYKMLNKKSQIEDLLQFLFVVIVIVLIVLFFSLRNLNKTKAIKENIALQTNEQDSKQLLMNYLRSPSTFNNLRNINIAELINLYFITNDKNLLEQINAISIDYFSKSHLETEVVSWSLEMEYSDKKIIIESERSRTRFILRKKISDMIIPAYYGKSIKIKLFQTMESEQTQGIL